MKKRIRLIFFLLPLVSAMACVFSCSILFAQPTQAGVIGVVLGSAEVASSEGQSKIIQSGDAIYLGDQVTTQEDGHLQILLMDQTVFTLGPSSSIVVDEFVYDPKTEDGKVTAEVIKGIFRVVSGQIAHKKPENMIVNLPAGTIGFRGTIVTGSVTGFRSLIVLMGPKGGEGTSPSSIVVGNTVDGKMVFVDIDEKGYGTIIEGANVSPLPMFKISNAELFAIAAALKGASPDGNATLGGTVLSGNSGVDQTAQMMSLMSRMEEYSQKAAQGGTVMPPMLQPVTVSSPPGRDDGDN